MNRHKKPNPHSARGADPTSLHRFRNLMRGTRQPVLALSHARQTMPPSLYTQMIEWLGSLTFLSEAVFHPRIPRGIRRLKTSPVLEAVSPYREIQWAGAYLRESALSIRRFVELSSKFERELLHDAISSAEATLDEIEHELGCSIWLIKNRIALLQASHGLDAQKQYTAHIRSAQSSSIVAYVAYKVSVRCEPTVTPASFIDEFNQDRSLKDLDKDFFNYLRYHVTSRIDCDPESMAGVLRHESSGSIVDYYESLLAAARASLNDRRQLISLAFIGALKQLARMIPDPRIHTLLFQLGDSGVADELTICESSFSASEYVLCGGYEYAFSAAMAGLLLNPHKWDLIDVAARSRAILEQKVERRDAPLAVRLVSLLCAVASGDETTAEDVAELQRLGLNYSGRPWADSIAAYLARESSSISRARLDLFHGAVSGVSDVHPLRLIFMHENRSSRYVAALRNSAGDRLGTRHAILLSARDCSGAGSLGLAAEEEALLCADISLRSGSYAAALDFAERLKASTRVYYRRLGTKIECHCHIELGQVEEAASTAAYVLTREREMYRCLPIAEIAKKLGVSERKKMAANISVSILLDLYSKHINADLDAVRNYAYEDFLFARGLEKPSQLAQVRDRFDTVQLIYFLRYVCVEPVMDCSTAFDSSREVTEERLAVCRLLLDIDPDGADTYRDEVKNLLRRLMVQQRMREIEQSKIYVDTEGIRQSAHKSIKESFNRYMAFLQENVHIEVPTVHAALHKAKAGDYESLRQLSLPRNEMSSIFESMVIWARDAFVGSKEHGLDGYLSVRIRHGTLSGQLRRPLEEARLITQKDSAGSYRKNEYWIERIGEFVDSSTRYEIANRLASFAEEFDAFVRNIVKTWIQVKRDPAGVGLFDLTITQADLALLASMMTPSTTFDEFTDILFYKLWYTVDLNLEYIRNKIQSEAKPKLHEILTSLESDIERIGYSADVRNITHTIRKVRTDLQFALDRITEWFRRARIEAEEPYSLDDLINISVETVRTVSRGFKISIPDDEACTVVMLRGLKQLASLVDVFFIIFENIVRHSDLPAPEARVHVTICEDAVHLLVTNDLGAGAAQSEAIERVNSIRTIMQGEQHLDSVRSEGGTGFHKIRKILTHDFGSDQELDFGFDGTSAFYVKFTLQARSVLQYDVSDF